MRGLLGLAGIVVALGIAAGCGGGGGGGGPATTKVTVVHPGPSFAGELMAIVLDDSAGRLVSSTAVTTSGADEVTVPHDGSVILAAAYGTTGYSWAMASRPPGGTTIHLPDMIASPAPTPTGFQTWNLTWTPIQLASEYHLFTPCGSIAFISGTAATVSTANCTERTTAKVLVAAYNSNSRPLAWHLTDSMPVVPNVTTNLPITLDQTTVQTLEATVMVGASSQPPNLAESSVTLDDPENAARIFYSQNVPTPGNLNLTTGGTVPDVTPVIVSESVSVGFAFAYRSRHLASVPYATSFDTRDFELPTVPVYDAPTRAWSWSAPSFGDGQVFLSEMSHQGSFVLFAAALPPGDQGMVAPGLPPEFMPPSFESFLAGGSVMLYDGAPLNGYADFVEVPLLADQTFLPVPFDYVALGATTN